MNLTSNLVKKDYDICMMKLLYGANRNRSDFSNRANINIYLRKKLGSLNAEFPGRIYVKVKNNGV